MIPFYNEEASIGVTLLEVSRVLSKLSRFEIIAVDDGSTDCSAAVAAQLAAKTPSIRLLRHEKNKGYGAALKTGISKASLCNVAIIDADMNTSKGVCNVPDIRIVKVVSNVIT